jgi:hypothetical protein
MKGIFTIMIATMLSAPTFAADISGKVGIASDNIFRGISMSDGFGYSAQGSVSLDNGIFAGASVMSLDENSDLMTTMLVGYGFDLGGVDFNVAYVDRGFQGVDIDGWEELNVRADFDLFGVYYSKGLDDAGDFYKVDSSALKVVDVAYGDWDNAGSYWEVSKSFDLAAGSVKVGYIDHELNDEDFSDKITDVDNFYVGYTYKF